jgi:hypothetical protein
LSEGSAHLRGTALQALVATLEQGLGAENLHRMDAAQRVEQEVEPALLGEREVMRRATHAPARQRRKQSDTDQQRQRHQHERAGEIPDPNQIKQGERQIEHGLQGRTRPSLTQGADGGKTLGVIAVAVGFQGRERSMEQALHGLTMRLRLGGCRHSGEKPAAHVPEQCLQHNSQSHRDGEHDQGAGRLVRQNPVVDLQEGGGQRQRQQGDQQRRLEHGHEKGNAEAADQSPEGACQPWARGCRQDLGCGSRPVHSATFGHSAVGMQKLGFLGAYRAFTGMAGRHHAFGRASLRCAGQPAMSVAYRYIELSQYWRGSQ